jgi:histidinol-phosphate/aromatic aminotransferase/cobyric acid decarboxylase-like protein
MSQKEKFKNKLLELKVNSGNHSPSIATLYSEIPNFEIKIDACFLSNPYATELFLDHLDKDLLKSGNIRNVLEFYPPQNRQVAKFISKLAEVESKNIFVGNGAIEIIQAVLQRFVLKKLCVIIPTFSSYYEFVRPDTEIIYFELDKEEDYSLNSERLIRFVKENDIDSLVIINPNNPNGAYLDSKEILIIVEELRFLHCLIIDESFIHFAYESIDLNQISSEKLISEYANLVVIKSMSKDFGIAGIRAGYAVMSSKRVDELLNNGYLWNISGLADYFFRLYSDIEFMKAYEVVRKKYIMNTLMFMNQIKSLPHIKLYPSKANFVLLELCNSSSFDFSIDLLFDHGVYVRDCSDKIGLNGQFVRVASRTFEENLGVISAMKTILG